MPSIGSDAFLSCRRNCVQYSSLAIKASGCFESCSTLLFHSLHLSSSSLSASANAKGTETEVRWCSVLSSCFSDPLRSLSLLQFDMRSRASLFRSKSACVSCPKKEASAQHCSPDFADLSFSFANNSPLSSSWRCLRTGTNSRLVLARTIAGVHAFDDFPSINPIPTANECSSKTIHLSSSFLLPFTPAGNLTKNSQVEIIPVPKYSRSLIETVLSSDADGSLPAKSG
mmetsp:Transcript_16098/g.23887  ORF Transcript_16098/g.23887 Transcript_16098/m.23887 type:complete len:228 (+) Transcript_16098:253-936(+)